MPLYPPPRIPTTKVTDFLLNLLSTELRNYSPTIANKQKNEQTGTSDSYRLCAPGSCILGPEILGPLRDLGIWPLVSAIRVSETPSHGPLAPERLSGWLFRGLREVCSFSTERENKIQKGLEVCCCLWGVPSRPSPGSYPRPVQVPSRVRGGPVQIRHVLCFTVFRTHPGPEVGPSRPVLVPSCSRAFLTGSGLDGQKQTSWPLPKDGPLRGP